ncbi:WD40 repeat domain-containing protein, partial [Actinomadura parmotrematis]|nr:hypothetical protein [Actinomadura parmotrematis]
NAVCAYTTPDGQPRLATGGDDRTVRIWDPETGTALNVLHGHNGLVNAVCAYTTPDGQPRLATGGSDHTVRIWDQKELISKMPVHHRVNAITMCPTGLSIGLAAGLLMLDIKEDPTS